MVEENGAENTKTECTDADIETITTNCMDVNVDIVGGIEKMEKKITEWDYMGKRYRWTKKARHRGYITCTCVGCKRLVKHLISSGQLSALRKKVKG